MHCYGVWKNVNSRSRLSDMQAKHGLASLPLLLTVSVGQTPLRLVCGIAVPNISLLSFLQRKEPILEFVSRTLGNGFYVYTISVPVGPINCSECDHQYLIVANETSGSRICSPTKLNERLRVVVHHRISQIGLSLSYKLLLAGTLIVVSAAFHPKLSN